HTHTLNHTFTLPNKQNTPTQRHLHCQINKSKVVHTHTQGHTHMPTQARANPAPVEGEMCSPPSVLLGLTLLPCQCPSPTHTHTHPPTHTHTHTLIHMLSHTQAQAQTCNLNHIHSANHVEIKSEVFQKLS